MSEEEGGKGMTPAGLENLEGLNIPTPPAGQGEGEQKKEIDPALRAYLDSAIPSFTGKISKAHVNQLRDEFMPILTQIQDRLTQKAPSIQQPEGRQKFNEELTEMIMSGDAVGAFEKYNSVMGNVKQTVSKENQTKLNTAITDYRDDPLYKDIHTDAVKLGNELIGQGWPPKEAAKHAFTEVRAAHIVSKLTDEQKVGLGFLETGKRKPPESKIAKMPEKYEAQCRADISEGLFKSRDEWIANLDPAVRSRMGV